MGSNLFILREMKINGFLILRGAVPFSVRKRILQQSQQQSNRFSTNQPPQTGGQPTTIYWENKLTSAFFDTRNRDFPLVGDVTSASAYDTTKQPELGHSLTAERGLRTLWQLTQEKGSEQPTNADGTVAQHGLDPAVIPKEMAESDEAGAFAYLRSPTVDVAAVPCPKLLRKDLPSLFPGQKFAESRTVTVLNVTQKSEHDMSTWSPAVELERDTLIAKFVSSANAVCTALYNRGFWADFIDPTSGRPYLGQYTNATLFETDERYKQLGVTIDDLGCCKIIKHLNWGTHAFVGSIFTDAPFDAEEIQTLVSSSAKNSRSNQQHVVQHEQHQK